jgi:branched-chain amino acid transport system substrate-binding protein
MNSARSKQISRTGCNRKVTAMRKEIACIALTLLLSGVGLLVPGTAATDAQAQANQPQITIGVPLPLSGDLQAFGIMMKRSFEMAQRAVNGRGGINGRPLKLIFADDQGKPDEAVSVVTDLVKNSKVAMLIGGYSSNATYAMARTAEKLDIPFLICTASSDKITQRSCAISIG